VVTVEHALAPNFREMAWLVGVEQKEELSTDEQHLCEDCARSMSLTWMNVNCLEIHLSHLEGVCHQLIIKALIRNAR
jgi:hypothetical protein